jgi:hypothetical protein
MFIFPVSSGSITILAPFVGQTSFTENDTGPPELPPLTHDKSAKA